MNPNQNGLTPFFQGGTMPSTFTVGQQVQWSPAALESYALKRVDGGPFTVVSVREVPDTYTCNTPVGDNDHRDYGCPYHWHPGYDCQDKTTRDHVGHHQWLTVRPSDSDKPLPSAIQPPLNAPGTPAKFSGFWFAPAA